MSTNRISPNQREIISAQSTVTGFQEYLQSTNGSLNITGTISGTTTANQGTANTLTNGWPVKVTDGTNVQPTGDSSARSIHTTVDNSSLAVTGTFWQATQPISGTVTANAGTGTFNIQSNASVNVAQIAGSTTSTAASGTQLVGIADGTGNALTSNSTTYTSKKALDANLLGTLGTAFTTAGFVDIKGADGNVFVRQTTAANLNATVVGQATGSAVPANAFYQGFNAATALPTAATAGNLTGAMSDKFGRPVVLPNTIRDLVGTQTTTITSSTSETTIVTAASSIFNDLINLFISNTSATACRVDIRDTTAGSVIFQLYIPAGDVRGICLVTPWPQTSSNSNWTATCSASVADIRISTMFAKNK